MSSAGSDPSQRPIIRITKKKKVVAGHHGGAWKVAYADFVTAMMAFFLVMWIISMDQAVKDKIQDYFNTPFSTNRSKAGISRMATGGKSPVAIGVGVGLSARNWKELAMSIQRDRFTRTKHRLEAALGSVPRLKGLAGQVEMRMTSYGLLIELVEAERSPFFASGSAQLPPQTQGVLRLIAAEIGRLPNPVWIEGHTDAVPFGSGAGYTNWELSADRANAARRVLEASGLRRNQVDQVRGFADSRLREKNHPAAASNRRVSIVVLYRSLPDDEAEEPERAPDEKDLPTHITRGEDAKHDSLELTLERLHARDMQSRIVGLDPKNPLGIRIDARRDDTP